jgi:F420-dependent oxidoreductase-like protein
MAMTGSKKLSFGIKTSQQYTTYEDIVRIWHQADATPIFEHAWLFDHFMPIIETRIGPCLEGWSLLAALAAQTQRVRLGVMVTGVTYRHPAILANMAATIDLISHGRLDFGIGAAWNEREHLAYGIPFPSDAERIRRVGEACEVILRLWTQSVADFDGHYYRLKEARCEPKPIQKPHPPLVIGGNGERLLFGIAARYAAICNYGGVSIAPAVYRHKTEALDKHCLALGRDPTTLERSVQFYVDVADLPATRRIAREHIEAGATHVILQLRAPYPATIVQRLAEEVAEPLAAEFAKT